MIVSLSKFDVDYGINKTLHCRLWNHNFKGIANIPHIYNSIDAILVHLKNPKITCDLFIKKRRLFKRTLKTLIPMQQFKFTLWKNKKIKKCGGELRACPGD